MDFAIEWETKRCAGIAIILVALDQHFAVLDQQQAGDALMRKKIVERQCLVFEPVLDLSVRRRPSAAAAEWLTC